MGRTRFDVLFIGYFGFGNLGDELILGALATAIRRAVPDARLAALSGPQGLGEGPSRWVHAVPRSDGLAVRAALSSTRVACIGPGGIFQDATSLSSCAWYALQTWRAAHRRARVVHVGQSLGPLNTPLGRGIARCALRMGQEIVLRDGPSVALAGHLGCEAHEGADLAWLLPTPDRAAAESRRRVGLAPRPWPRGNTSPAWWAQVAREVERRGLEPVWLPMAPDDARLAGEAERLTGRTREAPKPFESGEEALDSLVGCRAVIGMRLHSLVLGCLSGAEPMGVSYDPKIDGLLAGLGRTSVCDVMEPCSPKEIGERLDRAPDPVPWAAIDRQKELAGRSVEAVLRALEQAR